MHKRLFDLVVGSALLVMTAPLFGLIAAAVWLDGGSPVFFRQIRVGRHGRRFTLHKFRTLHPDTGRVRTPREYTTRVGAWLRRWGLDELPQLWNVVQGSMSLVGPRPTLPEQVARYGPFERQRLQVRPGLTGWAQIHGRNALPWSERIELDVWYARHRTLWLDVRILLRTPRALLGGMGTYGPAGVNPDFTSNASS
jgi:lipopolysaccharide/colanic/teichoic acid biosynthesis glycosyltransferase